MADCEHQMKAHGGLRDFARIPSGQRPGRRRRSRSPVGLVVLVLVLVLAVPVIAAVVLGGTSLMGGRGTVLGTALGALTIAVIGNGLILAHISPFFTQIVTGLIILVAIWLNTRVFRTARLVRSR